MASQLQLNMPLRDFFGQWLANLHVFSRLSPLKVLGECQPTKMNTNLSLFAQICQLTNGEVSWCCLRKSYMIHEVAKVIESVQKQWNYCIHAWNTKFWFVFLPQKAYAVYADTSRCIFIDPSLQMGIFS